jgi:hypothetical protein
MCEVHAMWQGLAVAELENHFHLMEKVVSSLEAYQHRMHSILPLVGQQVVRSLEDQASLLAQAGMDFDHHTKAVAGHLQFCYRMAFATNVPISTDFCER